MIPVLIVLLLISISLGKNGIDLTQKVIKENKILDVEKPTTINQSTKINNIIKKGLGIIHKDSVCTIHLVKVLGTPTLFYVYKKSLTPEQLTDRFALHVVLKDASKLKSTKTSKHLQMDFYSKHYEVMVGNKKNFVFSKPLTHNLLELDNIKYINTGRFSKGVGRSYFVRKVKVNNIFENDNSMKIENIVISIKRKNFNKLKTKRLEALKNSILINEDNDITQAKVDFKDLKNAKAQIRLKGDWVDHLTHPTKWSFKLIMEDGYTVNGLRKFSVQHPMVRNYLWEWLFNKAMKEHDLIGIKYNFVNVEVQITDKDHDKPQIIPFGIMAFEEAFDKILIENNNRREGLILAFDESLLWSDRSKQAELNLEPNQRNKKIQAFTTSPIKVYNENKVLADPKLLKQFNIAKDLIDGLKAEKLKVSEVFDMDKLTMFVALTNLFGGGHGLTGHNLKIYFNPVTNKMEPISWDSNSGHKIVKILNYKFSNDDPVYTQKLIEKLELVSSTEFVNNLIDNYKKDIKALSSTLGNEFTGTFFDYSVLEYNSNVIKKKIHPSDVIISSMQKLGETEMEVNIENVSTFPVIIDGLVHNDGKTLSKQGTSFLRPYEQKKITFKFKESFVNAFVSKKNKKGNFRYPKDLRKINIQYRLLGQDYVRKSHITPYSESENLDEKLAYFKKSITPAFESFDFVKVDEDKKIITFKAGDYTLNETLMIPSGYSVKVRKGFNLDFTKNASLISYSSFTCIGTKENPIKFYSSDSEGAGIFISNATEKSVFNHCQFSNLSNPNSDIWELSGAVNFNETEVEIRNSLFKKNRCEDGLNIIKSKFILVSSEFHDTKSDAFDGDFVEGRVVACNFVNSGNDGVDVSGSKLFVKDLVFENPSDKAISAGENSTINGKNISIIGGEIGIVSKDLSTVTLSKVDIKDTRLAFSSFQKKSEFGVASITINDLKLDNNEEDYLIETGSSLTIDNKLVNTVSDKVIDKMYGKEYGKSSR